MDMRAKRPYDGGINKITSDNTPRTKKCAKVDQIGTETDDDAKCTSTGRCDITEKLVPSEVEPKEAAREESEKEEPFFPQKESASFGLEKHKLSTSAEECHQITPEERKDILQSLKISGVHCRFEVDKFINKFFDDEEIMLALISNKYEYDYDSSDDEKSYMTMFDQASDRLRNDKSFLMKVICMGCIRILHRVPDQLLADKEFVMDVLDSKKGSHLAEEILARSPLCKDKEVVLKAIFYQPISIFAVPKTFYQDPDVLSLVDSKMNCIIHRLHKEDVPRKRDLSELPEDLRHNQLVLREIFSHEIKMVRAVMGSYDFGSVRSLLELCRFNPLILDVPDRLSTTGRPHSRRTMDLATPPAVFRDNMQVMKAVWTNNPQALRFASSRIRTAFRVMEDVTEYHRLSFHLQNDKDIALEAVVQEPSIMEALSPDLQKDRTFALEAVRRRPSLFNNIHPSLQSQRYFVWQAVRSNPEVYRHLDGRYQTDPVICATAFGRDGSTVAGCPASVLNDFTSAFELVSRWPMAIRHISTRFRADRRIALAAGLGNLRSLRFVPDSLKADRSFILRLLPTNPSALEFAAYRLRSDRDFVVEAIRQGSAQTASFAADKLWKDREFVLNVVRSCPRVIADKAKAFAGDREIVLEAIKADTSAIEFANDELFADRDFVLKVLKISWKVLTKAPKELRSDREIILEAVKGDTLAMEYANVDLFSDREFVLKVLDISWKVLPKASKELRSDHEIILKATKSDASAIHYANKDLFSDRDFMLKVLKTSRDVLEKAPSQLRGDHEIVLEAMRSNGTAIKYANIDLLSDREFMLKALRVYGLALEKAPKAFQRDTELVLAAVQQDASSLRYSSPTLRSDMNFMASVLAAPAMSYACLPRRWQFADVSLRKSLKVAIYTLNKDGCQNVKIDNGSLQGKVRVMQHTALETYWLQQQVTSYLPEDVGNLVLTFSGIGKEIVQKKLDRANNLKRCIPIFVALHDQEVDWYFVSIDFRGRWYV